MRLTCRSDAFSPHDVAGDRTGLRRGILIYKDEKHNFDELDQNDVVSRPSCFMESSLVPNDMADDPTWLRSYIVMKKDSRRCQSRLPRPTIKPRARTRMLTLAILTHVTQILI